MLFPFAGMKKNKLNFFLRLLFWTSHCWNESGPNILSLTLFSILTPGISASRFSGWCFSKKSQPHSSPELCPSPTWAPYEHFKQTRPRHSRFSRLALQSSPKQHVATIPWMKPIPCFCLHFSHPSTDCTDSAFILNSIMSQSICP